MYKRILVAVDGSKTSDLALAAAIKLAKGNRAKLRLVHVVDEAPAYMANDLPYSTNHYLKYIRDTGRKELARCATKANAARVKFDTKFIVIEGLTQRVSDAIIKQAKRWPADLIVIGTHGRRGFNRLFMGSVAGGNPACFEARFGSPRASPELTLKHERRCSRRTTT